jgi:hypothetical protein
MSILDFAFLIIIIIMFAVIMATLYHAVSSRSKDMDLNLLPAMVQNQLRELSEERHSEYLEEYERRRKRTGIAYLFSFIGCHYAYVRKWGILALFWLTAGGMSLWAFIDLFRIPGIVRDCNRDVAIAVLKDLRSVE